MTALHIFDGTAQLFRHHFGGATHASADGTEVGAVLGLCASVVRALRDHQPPLVAVVFDVGRESFRKQIFPEYKANRAPPPEALLPQFDIAPKAVRALGLPVFGLEGFEADDLMATLTVRARRGGREVVLHTKDKDLLQLVGPGVSVCDPQTREKIDANGVFARLGVRPDQVVDYLGLVGDTVDNLPGVAGVGPRTAATLLSHYPHLDDIYANLERILYLPVRGARPLQDRLARGVKQALLSRDLAVLRQDLPIPGLTRESDLHPRFPGEDADEFFEWLGSSQALSQMRALFED